MRFELWNTSVQVLVASWSSEAEAREQIERYAGLEAEPLQLIERAEDGSTRVLAEPGRLQDWARSSG